MGKMPQKRKSPPPTESDYRSELLFQVAVLKGAIEKCDETAYFGSLMGYLTWRDKAVKSGLVRQVQDYFEPTPLGQRIYDTYLKGLPQQGRAYLWDWPEGVFQKIYEEIRRAR